MQSNQIKSNQIKSNQIKGNCWLIWFLGQKFWQNIYWYHALIMKLISICKPQYRFHMKGQMKPVQTTALAGPMSASSGFHHWGGWQLSPSMGLCMFFPNYNFAILTHFCWDWKNYYYNYYYSGSGAFLAASLWPKSNKGLCQLWLPPLRWLTT